MTHKDERQIQSLRDIDHKLTEIKDLLKRVCDALDSEVIRVVVENSVETYTND